MYRSLDPEAATEPDEGTVMDVSVHPPRIEKLAVRFDFWGGDDLLYCFPYFLVTERLRTAIEQAQLSGCSFEDVVVTRSIEFEDLEEFYPGREFPKFYWMKVFGRAGEDDFGLSDSHCLVASEKAFDLLKSFKIDNCEVEEFRGSCIGPPNS
ncbi:MAG: hypothetical protein WD851_23540 [Pirellulales bacterium]